MPRMMVEIDDRLLTEARRLCGAPTKRQTIEVALRELIRRHRLIELAAMGGTVPVKLTRADLRGMRERR